MELIMEIREATEKDLGAITEIYNYAIEKTTATFDTELKSTDDLKSWFLEHGPNNPIIVVELEDEIIGWASLSKWSDRCAYSDTAEISLYVKEEHQGKGFGKKLMEAIIEEGRKTSIHTLIARIVEDNEVSINLHESVGFKHIGVMREVGNKFGKLLDIKMMQLIYKE
jgi:phosphinothricin acetyltransferase